MRKSNKTTRYSIGLVLVAGIATCMSAAAKDGKPVPSPLHLTYLVGEEPVTLVNGVSDVVKRGPRSVERTYMLGLPVYGDLDRDGDKDAVVVLVHESDGMEFFHLAAALRGRHGFIGGEAMLLGARISQPVVTLQGDGIRVDFRAHHEDESPDGPPTWKRSLQLTLRGLSLHEPPH